MMNFWSIFSSRYNSIKAKLMSRVTGVSEAIREELAGMSRPVMPTV
jgi:hypothetical protein